MRAEAADGEAYELGGVWAGDGSRTSGMRNVIIGVLLALLLMPLLRFACADRPSDRYEATVRYPATSPSAKYRMVVMRGNDGDSDFSKFDIVSTAGPTEALFSCKWHFRTRDTTYFLWGPDDRAWVYSGDLGTFYWEHINDYAWKNIFTAQARYLRQRS